MAFDKEHTIGIILPNITNQFSAKFLSLATVALEKEGFRAIVSLTDHRIEKERELLTYFSSTTNGILILSAAPQYNQIQDVVPSDIPVIFFNRKPDGCDRCCIIACDYSAVYQAVISMQRSGHKRIACICDNPEYSTTKEIVEAYQDAMKNLGVGFQNNWIYYTDNQNFDVANLVAEVSSVGCNAILAATQTLTYAFQDYLAQHNKYTDDQIYLTGYSNEESNTLAQYSIDTITQPVNQIVQLAVQQLCYLLANPNAPVKDYLLKGSLRVRSFNKFENESILK